MSSALRRHPVEIRRILPEEAPDHGAVDIRWSDGAAIRVPNEILRRACPCATCLEHRGVSQHAKPLTPKKSSLLNVVKATLDESLRLSEIWPVGNYAVGLRWADGHDTGIYTYDLLSEITNALPKQT